MLEIILAVMVTASVALLTAGVWSIAGLGWAMIWLAVLLFGWALLIVKANE